MSRPETPYSKYLGDRDPVAAIADTMDRVKALASGWTEADFERTYAPGKWTARQILAHLAQTEIALGTRIRMALTSPGYTAQPFDQDRWLALEASMPARDALSAFLALAAMNRALFASLSTTARQATMNHPEHGSLSVEWVIRMIAGHQINHQRQLEQIASA